jgi:hypothetical protein
MNKQFIGFGTLEKFLKAIDLTKPVNADSIVIPGKSGVSGIALNEQAIIVSQANQDEILYCNIIISRYQSLAGSSLPLSPSEERIYQERAESAWQIVKQVMEEAGAKVREALLATPQNLRTLDGSADCLKYNKTTGLYERYQELVVA